MAEPDPFLDHYFRRIDPDVAASFTDEQRRAIKVMFGARGVMRHAVDIRRSIGFGRQRFYMVLLAGRERRSSERLQSEGMVSRGLDGVMTVLAVLVVALPVLVVLYVVKTVFGVDVVLGNGLHEISQTVGDQLRMMFR